MATNKEKNYTELNAELVQLNVKTEELNRQLEELAAEKKELEAEINARREQVILTQIRLTNQLIENTRLMIEMGIDPDSITMGAMTNTCEDSMGETAEPIEENKETDMVCSPEGIAGENDFTILPDDQETGSITDGEETFTTPESVEDSEDLLSDDGEECEEEPEETTPKSKRKKVPRLLKPYYYVWGLRRGSIPKTCDVPKWKHTSPRLLFSFERYVRDGRINRSMNLGNLNYRESYPNPNESRIYSANGIAPTLTRMHSNLDIWIGKGPCAIEEQSNTDAA